MKIKCYTENFEEKELNSFDVVSGFLQHSDYQTYAWRVPLRAQLFHYIVFRLGLIPEIAEMFSFLNRVEAAARWELKKMDELIDRQ